MWIFDEDANARAPMFEYFRARQLVTEQGTPFLYFILYILIAIPLKGFFKINIGGM